MGLDGNYHIPSYHSNQPTPKYVTLQAELAHDRNYHTPSYHSNQPTPKYVTLQAELPLDRNYHIPSYHSNPSFTHNSNQLRSLHSNPFPFKYKHPSTIVLW